MKALFILFSLIIYKGSNAQDSTRKYFFKEVSWSINLPSDFTKIDSVEDAARNKRGEKAIEKTIKEDVDVSATSTLISAKKSFNYFNATITPYDPKIDGNYEKLSQELKDIMHATMVQNISNARIDSSSSKTTIDGLVFNKFTITISIQGTEPFDMILLYRLYKGYDFGITYLYLDKKTKEQIENMLLNSRFSK